MYRRLIAGAVAGTSLAVLCAAPVAVAEDDAPAVVMVRRMTLELANDVAMNTVKACRADGFQVSAVVVDRSGFEQVVARDVHASRFTTEIARRKANAVILAGVSSGDLRRNRGDIRPELNHIDGLIIMEGGEPIVAAGSVIGAVGVSGAPGGDLDAKCALAGIASVQDRLDFVE